MSPLGDYPLGSPHVGPIHEHAWEYCVTCEDGSQVCVNHPVPFPHKITEDDVTPERIAHSFAMKYGLRAHLTYEAAVQLEADLTLHLIAWMHR